MMRFRAHLTQISLYEKSPRTRVSGCAGSHHRMLRTSCCRGAVGSAQGERQTRKKPNSTVETGLIGFFHCSPCPDGGVREWRLTDPLHIRHGST